MQFGNFTQAQSDTALTFVDQAATRTALDPERRAAFAVQRIQSALKIPVEQARDLFGYAMRHRVYGANTAPPVEEVSQQDKDRADHFNSITGRS